MQISIMQWNVWYQEDIENIAKFIKKHDPDIVCLQELTIDYEKQSHRDTPKYLADYLGYNFKSRSFPTDPNGGNVMANAIFSRFQINSSASEFINEPLGTRGYDDEPRVYVEVTLDVAGHTVRVGTVHMSYTHEFKLTDRKKNEALKLFKYIQSNSSKYMLAGDFNMTPGSDGMKIFTAKFKNLGPSLERKTWTTKSFSYGGFDETKLNWRLDYIFGTNDWKPVSSEVLKTKYSDHLPLFSVVEVT